MQIPDHIAVILDGNRRYAQKRFGNPLLGHYYGARKVGELIKWCMDEGVKELTLYCFSIENFNRSRKELDYLFNLFRDNISKYTNDPRIMKKGVRVDFIGRLSLFPKDVQKGMAELMKKTRKNNNFRINFAVAYSGRCEIVDALKKLVRKGVKAESIDESAVQQCLYLKSYPDLLIRTSETRISNFLPWQIAYSELIFMPSKLWPEFSKADFKDCIKEFSRRKRRFGA